MAVISMHVWFQFVLKCMRHLARTKTSRWHTVHRRRYRYRHQRWQDPRQKQYLYLQFSRDIINTHIRSCADPEHSWQRFLVIKFNVLCRDPYGLPSWNHLDRRGPFASRGWPLSVIRRKPIATDLWFSRGGVESGLPAPLWFRACRSSKFAAVKRSESTYASGNVPGSGFFRFLPWCISSRPWIWQNRLLLRMRNSSPVDKVTPHTEQMKQFKWNTKSRAYRTQSLASKHSSHAAHFVPNSLKKKTEKQNKFDVFTRHLSHVSSQRRGLNDYNWASSGQNLSSGFPT